MKLSLTLLLGLATTFLFGYNLNPDDFNNDPVDPKGVVEGVVVEKETQTGLEFATVTAMSPDNSKLISGTVTDIDGSFQLELPYGTYNIKIEFLSFETVTFDNIVLSKDTKEVTLDRIELAPSAEMLDEVEVVSQKSELQFSLDKRVFNIGQDLSNKGGSAEDILDNIPSVAIDVEGNVSLRGSENVRILVDGRPSSLVGIGDTEGLKSLPASMIEKVEVITNASARYDAEGTAGIINIILKKEKLRGLNGAIDGTIGTPRNYGIGLNMNYRKKDVNFFVNFGFRDRERDGGGKTFQEFYGDVDVPYTEQYRDRVRGGRSYSIRTGMDLYITERDILTGSFMYRYGNDYSDNIIKFNDYNAARELIAYSERIQDEEETEPNLEYAINYERKFAEEDRKLTASIQFRNDSETESADYIERFYDNLKNPLPKDDLLQRSINDELQKDLLLQADYVHPLNDNTKFEVGGKISKREIQNDYLVEEYDGSIWNNLSNISNNFNYDEDIYAVYGIYATKIGQWSYQAGLRAEHSHVLTLLEENNESNDRTYTNLFPTIHVTYELSAANSLQASYSRRISRPRFWYLNPFFSFSNNRNVWGGNPNLDPEFTNSYELGYLRFWGSTTLGTSVYYRKTTDVIERISRVNEAGITRTQPENLSTQQSVGLEMTLTADVNKWWRLDASANLFRSKTRGALEDLVLESEATNWTNRLNSKMQFWQDGEFQLRFNYRAPHNTTQGRRKGTISLDMAVSKDLLDRKGTLTLSVRDLLDSRKWRWEAYGDNWYMDNEYSRRSRMVTVSFNYRINQNNRRNRGGDRGGPDGNGGGDMDGGDMF